MTLRDLGMFGDLRVVSSDALPPGIVYAFNPRQIARKLGLWPYGQGPRPDAVKLRLGRGPQTDDMRQMLDDLAAARHG